MAQPPPRDSSAHPDGLVISASYPAMRSDDSFSAPEHDHTPATTSSHDPRASSSSSSTSNNLSPHSPATSRSPSPGFPSPSSTFIPPPSEEEEIARMKELDIPGRAEGAKRSRSINEGSSEKRDDCSLSLGLGFGEAEGDEQSRITVTADGHILRSQKDSPRPTPLDDEEEEGGPLSPRPDGDDSSSYPLSSTPNPDATPNASFADERSSLSAPSPDVSSTAVSEYPPSSSAPSSPANSPDPRISASSHQHPFHAHRPLDLGTPTSHSAAHPGTIMYPQPQDEVDRPLPGDRSRPSQDRVLQMHEMIDARDKEFQDQADEKHRQLILDKTSPGLSEAELVKRQEEGLSWKSLPEVVVRDYAYARTDDRFSGKGPLRPSLFEKEDDDGASGSREPGPAWGFGGWKSDPRHDDDEEEEWRDDEEGGAYEGDEYNQEDEQDEEEVKQGIYQALYPFESMASSELSLKESDLVRVHKSGGVGWVIATLLSPNGEPLENPIREETEGLVPKGYLEWQRP